MYVATINVPGYMPMDDDPPVFEDPREAWDYLAGERRRGEDDEEEIADGYSETVNVLECLAGGDWENWGTDHIGCGSVVGPTPGGRIYDLGLAYSVSIVEED
jgi:hypothetical protein